MDKDYYHLMLDNLSIIPQTGRIRVMTRLWDIRKEFYDIVLKYPDIKKTYLGRVINSCITRTSNMYESNTTIVLYMIKSNIVLDWNTSNNYWPYYCPPSKCSELIMPSITLNLIMGPLPSIIINRLLDMYQTNNIIDLLIRSREMNNTIIVGIINDLMTTTDYYGAFINNYYLDNVRNQKIHKFNLIKSTVDFDNMKLNVVLQSTTDKRVLISNSKGLYCWKWKLFFGEQHLKDWKEFIEQREKNLLFSKIETYKELINTDKKLLNSLEQKRRSLKKMLQDQKQKIYSNVKLL